jgi:hypothetical protein
MKYRLPIEAYDTILYTGLHYVGRDTLLIVSSDAVVSVGGRIGTLHEFTIAMETEKPIGLLRGGGGVTQEIQTILDLSHPVRSKAPVIFEDSAEKLVEELTKYLDQEHAKYKNIYR